MQLSKQIVFGIGGIVLVGILGYLLMDTSLPSSFQREDGTSSLSRSGKVPHTSPTSNSGNTWGANPFQTGASSETSKPVFKAPNTEWKSRNVTLKDGRTVNYVFGEGDPKGVIPKLKDLHGWEGGDGYFQSETVRPKTEQLLAQFLSNPTLPLVLNRCGLLTKPGLYTSGFEAGLPYTIYTTDFSMEGMISIDSDTGRKILERHKFSFIGNVFNQIRRYETNELSKRINVFATDCLSADEIVAFDFLLDQYQAVNNSWSNSSLENRKEVCNFLEKKNCSYE